MESINQLVLNPPKSGGLENSPKTLELSPRQRKLVSIAEMARKLKGLPAMERAERMVTLAAWELALAELADTDLEASFQRAARNYTDTTKPFGVPQMLAAYDLLRLDRQRENRLREIEAERAQARDNMAERYACRHCQDRGAQFVRHSDGYSSLKICECKGGTRALCKEDGWMTNDKGEWYRASWSQPGEEYCATCNVLKDRGRCENCDDLSS